MRPPHFPFYFNILDTTMKRFIITLAIALLAIPASAQLADIFAAYTNGRAVGVAINADDTDTTLLVKYVGTGASGLVAVSAAGDLTFTAGVISSEAADTTFECPVSGALGGVIDVSDAACNTVGEVVNAINSSNNWVAVPVASLLSDDINCATLGCLVTISATQAKVNAGLALKADTSETFKSTLMLAPNEFNTIGTYFAGVSRTGVDLRRNPFVSRTFLAASNVTSTYVSGTSLWSVLQVTPLYARAGSTEQVVTLYGNVAGGATTVNKAFVTLSDNNRIVTDPNTKLLIRLTNSAAASAITHYGFGYAYVK